MPGRKFEAGIGYRYGFNGKENDNEVKGVGNQQDYGMRIYDPRLGRWSSVDNLQKLIPGINPYNFVYNSPLKYIDPDGKLGIEVHLKQDEKTGKYTVVSITISDDLMHQTKQSIHNSSFVEEHQWHDYMKITIENADGSISSPKTIVGKKRATTDAMTNWKWVADALVDDGYFEDDGGVMFTSSDGVGGAGRRTRNSVNVVNIDGIVAAMGGTAKLGDMKLPEVDESYFLELANKVKELYTTFMKEEDKASVGANYKDDSDYKKLLGSLNTLIERYNSEAKSGNEPYQAHCVNCQNTFVKQGNDTIGIKPESSRLKTLKGKVDTIDVNSSRHPKNPTKK